MRHTADDKRFISSGLEKITTPGSQSPDSETAEGGVFSGQLSVGSDQRNSHGDTESAEDSAFLDDQLEAEARVFACSDLLGAPHGGHGFAREVR